MPSAPRIAVIADAIVSQMNARSEQWSQWTSAERKLTINYTPEDQEALRIPVMMMARPESKLITRGKFRRDLMLIDIGIIKECDEYDSTTFDALALLAEEVTNYWAVGDDNGARKIDSEPTVVVMEATNDPLYSVEDLSKGLFFSHILLQVLELASV
jgi:hypothetical protein